MAGLASKKNSVIFLYVCFTKNFENMTHKKLKTGMIGGGRGAFIGSIHRHAFQMDGLIELVCGAFSSTAEKAFASGQDLFLDESRIYLDYKTMLETEAKMPAEKRIDFVTIVTPNHAHFEPAMMALDLGFHVVIEKPMTFTLDEAKLLHAKTQETGIRLCLTHTYSGYPMVKQARAMFANNDFGKIRKIWVEYPQGWLSELSEKEGNAQAAWRTDPNKSGKAGCMGDIGSHAAHLAEYISGLQITQLCANLNTVVDGRNLDDDGAVLLRFNNGASGVLIASQVAAGEENALKIKIHGERGGIEWHQMEPNTLLVKWIDKPTEILRAGANYTNLSPFMFQNCRTPGGHPEGYLEAFANIYRNFALTLMAESRGEKPTNVMLDFPNENDGVRGMAFIENVVASGQSDMKWWDFEL